MDSIVPGKAACPFCSGSDLEVLYRGGHHPFLKDHGPWDLHRCRNCGSLITDPLPSAEALQRLYASFEGGMIPSIRHIRDAYPLHAWFAQCLDHAMRYAGRNADPGQVFQWMDLGAGGGEMSVLLSRKFPGSKGVAMDISAKPAVLDGCTNVAWENARIGGPSEAYSGPKPDLALSITVTEHLSHPDVFLRKWIGELAIGGCLYLTSPRADCTAFRILGRKWPYYLPGEHLHIPTRKGMHALLQRLGTEAFGAGHVDVQVRAVVLPYPLGYFLSYFGLNGKMLGKLSDIPVRVPTGLLEAAIRRK